MNIGYLYGFSSYPPRDGGTIHVYNLVRQWREMGCRVHTVGGEENPDCIVHAADDDGIRSFLSSIDVLCVRVDRSMLSRETVRTRCMRAFAPRPIVWEINAPAEEALSRYRLGKPRGLAGVRKRAGERLAALRVWREDAYRRSKAPTVHAALCVSTALRAYARDLGITRCEVVPNGSDPALFGAPGRSETLIDGFAGFFKVVYSGDFRWPWQGFAVIDDLAARARRDGRKMLFVVLNNTPSGLIASHDNVLVVDRVPYADVPRYLAAADACLCVYRDFSWCRYGFYLSPLKLYDYMAAAKPVIASRMGQMAEAIEDGRTGLLAGDAADDIYGKIVFCQDHPDLAAQWGNAARDRVIGYYNWRRAAASSLAVFQSLTQAAQPIPAPAAG